ncbi:MAG: outer membrane beta-barrel protein [Flavobacteriales bacterium]|jgi:hypothetical protein|nr:outer membrane beta-barrel protein [Flavobacteriales bacterium]
MKTPTKHILIILSLLTVGNLSAQRWKSYKQEFGGGVGPSFLLGDVGGGAEEASGFIRDLNFGATRFGIQGHYQYYFHERMSGTAQLMYAQIYAADRFSKEVTRQNRNFTVKTHLVELDLMFRYYFIKEKFGHVYKLKGVGSYLLNQISVYGTLGVGYIYFNPTGKHLDGKFYPLQPLGTEGQGLPGGPEKYKRTSLVIPIGAGLRYTINPRLNVSADLIIRKTFTDYLDDVSTTYYDNTAIESANGEIAGYLADPNPGTYPTWTNKGEQRGNPDQEDFYFTTMFTVGYKLLKGASFRPRF